MGDAFVATVCLFLSVGDVCRPSNEKQSVVHKKGRPRLSETVDTEGYLERATLANTKTLRMVCLGVRQ